MKKAFEFIKEEKGDVFVWVAFLVSLFIFGLVLLFFEEVVQIIFTVGDIPAQQLAMEKSLWRGFAIIGAIALGLWAAMEGQRRR